MNRVWIRTLYKLTILFGLIIGFISYSVGCILIGKYLFGNPEGGLFTGIVGGLFLLLVNEVYQTSKREIEYENEKLMLKLKKDQLNKRLGI